jgi:hypothetical protein
LSLFNAVRCKKVGVARRVTGVLTAEQCMEFERRWLAAHAAYNQVILPARARLVRAARTARATGAAVPETAITEFRSAQRRAVVAARDRMRSGAAVDQETYRRSREN